MDRLNIRLVEETYNICVCEYRYICIKQKIYLIKISCYIYNYVYVYCRKLAHIFQKILQKKLSKKGIKGQKVEL